jgi:hypothetical protein
MEELRSVQDRGMIVNSYKRFLKMPAVAACLGFCMHCAAARTIDSPYQIGSWPGFRTAALSYTFDDNCSNQLAVAVPMFNEFSFKLTLFTVTTWVTSWAGLKSAALLGHEIASHTVTHVSLGGLGASTQDNELKNSRDAINANITNQKCVTMAYPNCIEATDAITSAYYFAARGCSGVIELKTPAKFMNISSIVCGSSGNYTTAQSLNGLTNQTVNSGGWCVLLFHGIDNDGGYSPFSSAVLRTHLQHVDSLKTVIWVSTFGNVARYIRERDSVSVIEVSNNGNSITVQVMDNLDNSIFNYPITLRRPLPGAWSNASVMQNGLKIASSIIGQNIVVDVVPDGGDIVLSNSGTRIGHEPTHDKVNSTGRISIRFSGNSLVFSIPAQGANTTNKALIDICGRKHSPVSPTR